MVTFIKKFLHSVAVVLYRSDPSEVTVEELSRDVVLNETIASLLDVFAKITGTGRRTYPHLYTVVQVSHLALILNLSGIQLMNPFWPVPDCILLDLSTALPEQFGRLFTWHITFTVSIFFALNLILNLKSRDGKQWKFYTVLPSVCSPRKLARLPGLYSEEQRIILWRHSTGLLFAAMSVGWFTFFVCESTVMFYLVVNCRTGSVLIRTIWAAAFLPSVIHGSLCAPNVSLLLALQIRFFTCRLKAINWRLFRSLSRYRASRDTLPTLVRHVMFSTVPVWRQVKIEFRSQSAILNGYCGVLVGGLSSCYLFWFYFMTNLPFGRHHVILTLVMYPPILAVTIVLISLAATAPQVVHQRDRHVDLLYSCLAALLKSRAQDVHLFVKYLLRLIDLETCPLHVGPELVVRTGPHPPLTRHVILKLALELTLLYLLFMRVIE